MKIKENVSTEHSKLCFHTRNTTFKCRSTKAIVIIGEIKVIESENCWKKI